MKIVIKKLSNNREVIFDSGRFDDWCVFVVESNGSKKAPFDINYFSDLQIISKKYSNNKVYNDFVQIYDKTTKKIDPDVTSLINKIVFTYNKSDQNIIEQWFTVLYASMIAEDNKENAILKKRIKRLGIYQVLIENIEPGIAANYSKGKKWQELNAIMTPKGF